MHAPPRRPRRPGALRRWAPYLVAALALLATSEMLWQWQTWPVRELLAISAGSAP
jgi:hypothetical protein